MAMQLVTIASRHNEPQIAAIAYLRLIGRLFLNIKVTTSNLEVMQ